LWTGFSKDGREFYEVLTDETEKKKERPWREKKMSAEQLSFAFDELDRDKAERLRECADILLFNERPDGKKSLHSMNSCRVRLCPMCGWRRSLKTYYNVDKVMQGLESEKTFGYIFLTLTVRNIYGDELTAVMDEMMLGWNQFTKYKAYQRAVKGSYRGLEVSHDVEPVITEKMYMRSRKYYDKLGLKVGDDNPNYDKYHPHFHCLLTVNESYFTDPAYYLDKKEWTAMWRKAMRLDYDPVVDVRRVKGNTAKAVAEVAKYTVKEGDYIVPKNWELTIETVKLLDEALHKRRLMTYGGKMKEWHKKLNLQDEMDGDLVHVDDEAGNNETDRKSAFVWVTGYNQYLRHIWGNER
jgi:plasmid rolling circle replication initiator protein Rep